jgi:hypothetical protein
MCQLDIVINALRSIFDKYNLCVFDTPKISFVTPKFV